MQNSLTKDEKMSFAFVSKESVYTSLLVRRFVFRMAEASAKRVTGDEPQ